ncbi:MAG: ABC transporter substrate-binding protein [Egibacteraceae bacterium]
MVERASRVQGSKRRPFRCGSACLLLLVSVTLAACGGAPTSGALAQAASDYYPVTVENCGHTLTFNEAPSRAVLPYQPIAEMFVGLGLADRAVGKVGYRGGLSEEAAVLPEQAEDFAGIPDVSDTSFPPPKEQMLALRPDFLLAYGDFDYGGEHAGAEGLATREQLKAAGAEVYTVVCPGDFSTQESLAAAYRSILDLGTIFNVSERAEARVAQMQQQIADVEAKVGNEQAVKVLAYTGGTGPIQTLGGIGINNELIEAAGGENVFAEAEAYFQAPLEEVAATDPDVFLIWADSEEATPRLDGSDEATFLFETFPNLVASRDRRVVVTDWVYTNPGWRVAQTVEDLARQFHPEAFDQ